MIARFSFVLLFILLLGACKNEPTAVAPPLDTSLDAVGDTAADAVGEDAKADVAIVPLCEIDTDCIGTGEVCTCRGECVVPVGSACVVDINCMPGQWCDTCSGECKAELQLCDACSPTVDAEGFKGCAEDGLCMPFSSGGNFCGRACLTDAGCPLGYTCVDVGASSKQCLPKTGLCADLGLCEDDGECPDGEYCGELKLCAVGCTSDTSCPVGKICVAARCVEPCSTNADCEAPKECAGGRCKIPGACESSSDCASPETYCNKTSGTCVPGCLQDSHCQDAAKECKNGTCVPKGCSHNYQCSFEEECSAGECVHMTKDHCVACSASAENQCGGDPNLCVSFQDEDGNEKGDFCLLTCEDDEVDKCPQGYGCQQVEGDGVNGFYCVRQCWQQPVGAQ